jgi:hypothetical protein
VAVRGWLLFGARSNTRSSCRPKLPYPGDTLLDNRLLEPFSNGKEYLQRQASRFRLHGKPRPV